jgi:hypothetical protein
MSSDTNLELPTDARFQRWEWRIQRIGWAIAIFVMVLAMLGFLGPGFAAFRKRSNADDSLTLRYDRFARHHCPGVIEAAIVLMQDRFEIELTDTILQEVRIERIEPPPLGNRLTEDGVAYLFEKNHGGDEVRVRFHVNYEHFGEIEGVVRLSNGEPVTLRQFVYP